MRGTCAAPHALSHGEPQVLRSRRVNYGGGGLVWRAGRLTAKHRSVRLTLRNRRSCSRHVFPDESHDDLTADDQKDDQREYYLRATCYRVMSAALEMWGAIGLGQMDDVLRWHHKRERRPWANNVRRPDRCGAEGRSAKNHVLFLSSWVRFFRESQGDWLERTN